MCNCLKDSLIRYTVFSCCIPILITTLPSGSAVRNHGRAHPAPCVRPRFCSVLRTHVQFGRFDKACATADVQ